MASKYDMLMEAMQKGFDGMHTALNAVREDVNSLNERVTALEGKSKPSNTQKGKVKDVPFTKHDGTVVMTTQAQADAWAKRRDSYVPKETVLKDWETKRASYKPSKELLDAIKANPTITRKEAKTLGFVGTSDDLWNLKYGTEGIIRKGTANR